MCRLFINASSELWQPTTRSMRIDGVVSSIRLENFFWSTLEEIADKDDMSVAQLITALYLESMDADHDLGNFSSFLRVCCARYLSLAADGYLDRTEQTALRSLNADAILDREADAMRQRSQLIALRHPGSKTVN